MKKKGLLIVYDPHTLQQFLWYYYTYGNGKEWDAFCLPNEGRGTYMDVYCKRAGIFSNVIKDDTEYLIINAAKKLGLLGEMIRYFIGGRQKSFARKIINKYVGNIDNYDEIMSICETGFVSGLCALFGDEKIVSYLDDGIGDYLPRNRWSNTYKISSIAWWQSYVINRMGYGCHGRFYFEPTKYCYKYCEVPNEMAYRNYKELRSFDMSNTDIVGYNQTLKKIYSGIENIDFDKVDAILFTDGLEYFSSNYQQFYDKCTKYIGERSKTVILKRHPMDAGEYHFQGYVDVVEIDNTIPAEVMLPYLGNIEIYFLIFSSVIIFMRQYGLKYNIFYSTDFYEDSLSEKKSPWKFISKEQTVDYCERFSEKKYKLIEVD